MAKFVVTLTEEEREQLRQLVRTGTGPARKRLHAQVLLQADAASGPDWPDQRIQEALQVSPSTIHRLRQRFVEESLEAALSGRPMPRRPQKVKLGVGLEAHLIALACSDPPAGRARWTVRLLADRMVESGCLEAVSEETVRKALKKATSTWPR
jgi:transposase